MVTKGIPITTTANRDVSTVSGSRHFPSSTVVGRTDLPDTVMYCFRFITVSDTNSSTRDTAISSTAMPVASSSRCWPRATYSTIRVVTVCTRPGLPMMEGMP